MLDNTIPTIIPIAILLIENDADRAIMSGVYMENRELMTRTIKHTYRGCERYIEDIINDICVSLIRSFPNWRDLEHAKLRSYIYTTAKREAIRHAVKNGAYDANVLENGNELLEHIPSKSDSKKTALWML